MSGSSNGSEPQMAGRVPGRTCESGTKLKIVAKNSERHAEGLPCGCKKVSSGVVTHPVFKDNYSPFGRNQ